MRVDTDREAVAAVATTSDRGTRVAIVLIAFGWHLVVNLPATVQHWSAYRAPWVPGTGWLLFAAVGLVAAGGLFRGSAVPAAPLIGVLLVVDAAVFAASPPELIFDSANWGWSTLGWFALLVFWDRPVGALVGVLAAGAVIGLAGLLADGRGGAADLSRYGMFVYATAVLPVALKLGAGLLDSLARGRAAAAAALAAVEADRLAAGHAHRERQARLELVGRTAGAVLAELADGRADPTDPLVQRRCALEASRLRRLIAESDDVPDPLLHELRACVDVAERNGLPVEFVAVGTPPPLPVEIRRRLAEPHTVPLAAATRWARLTVVAQPDEVVVSVTTPSTPVDGAGMAAVDTTDGVVEYVYERDEELVWTQTRWRAAPPTLADGSPSPSSTTTPWSWRGFDPGWPRSRGWRWWRPARTRTPS
ncbi:hypothetical protein O7627_06880 [Solwaraspora sp. WMMD1047]|uniref:hypothetical protein n=1 Tax=Solwaraspora sp. WMMD1047 TaxID=3016102 RepID=UPI002416E159|nr:hypothetical protein [Solwaraspora sp. WMMD1047]MDG4829030.1 hypothetical protein [Solwaraspora sp. WMMD1047]